MPAGPTQGARQWGNPRGSQAITRCARLQMRLIRGLSRPPRRRPRRPPACNLREHASRHLRHWLAQECSYLSVSGCSAAWLAQHSTTRPPDSLTVRRESGPAQPARAHRKASCDSPSTSLHCLPRPNRHAWPVSIRRRFPRYALLPPSCTATATHLYTITGPLACRATFPRPPSRHQSSRCRLIQQRHATEHLAVRNPVTTHFGSCGFQRWSAPFGTSNKV